MKLFFVFFTLFICFCVQAASGPETWRLSSQRGKARLIEGYQDFYRKLSEVESQKYGEWSEKKTSMLTLLLNEAWASPEMNCIYAGWPSRQIRGLCSSPARNNPDYQTGACASNELQCQPALFGSGLCVPTNTRSQRNLAFSNCTKEFKKENKSLEDVVNEIEKENKENDLFELMDLADKICTEGKQAKTPMCKNLKARVDELRKIADAHKVPEIEIQKLPPEKIELSIDLKPVIDQIPLGISLPQVAEVSDPVTETVKTVTTIMDELPKNSQIDCGPLEEPQQSSASALISDFEREEPRPVDLDYTTYKQDSGGLWKNTFKRDKNDPENILRPTGFKFEDTGPSSIAGSPLDPAEKVERTWDFVSDDNSRRETYLWITDDAGSGKLSQLMDSIIMIVPRKVPPTVEAIGDTVVVTLTTGEKVTYDKKTKEVKSGVMSEGAIDLNPDRFNRKFAAVNYTGTGISIRVDRRGEDPRLTNGKAVVTQNGKTCQVPVKDLWSTNTAFRYPNDKGLVDYLNTKCGHKFDIE